MTICTANLTFMPLLQTQQSIRPLFQLEQLRSFAAEPAKAEGEGGFTIYNQRHRSFVSYNSYCQRIYLHNRFVPLCLQKIWC